MFLSRHVGFGSSANLLKYLEASRNSMLQKARCSIGSNREPAKVAEHNFHVPHDCPLSVSQFEQRWWLLWGRKHVNALVWGDVPLSIHLRILFGARVRMLPFPCICQSHFHIPHFQGFRLPTHKGCHPRRSIAVRYFRVLRNIVSTG